MDGLSLSTKQKNVLFAILVAFVLGILWIVFSTIDNSGKYTLTVDVVPDTAYISINGVHANNKTVLYPGLYEIKTEADGFVSQTESIMVESDYSTSALLVPSSDEAKKWAEDNASLYSEEGYDPRSSYPPIQNQLPYSNSIFSIDSKNISAGKETITLDIVTLAGYQNAPIDKIRAFDFNPEDYVYNFNFKNPFENE